jgi:hypothetical protein
MNDLGDHPLGLFPQMKIETVLVRGRSLGLRQEPSGI